MLVLMVQVQVLLAPGSVEGLEKLPVVALNIPPQSSEEQDSVYTNRAFGKRKDIDVLARKNILDDLSLN